MTISLHYRPAVPDDIPTLMRIRLAVRENTLSDPNYVTAQMCLDYMTVHGRAWVCERDGEIIGFSYSDTTDPDHGSIWALFIDPDHEGLGAGKVLLQLAVESLFAHGYDEIRLGTAANTRADRFYAAQGWQRGEMRNAIEVDYRLRRA